MKRREISLSGRYLSEPKPWLTIPKDYKLKALQAAKISKPKSEQKRRK